jgi:acetolactate synthase I/II/III large subunit
MGEFASGHLAMRALKRAGINHLFTLSGGHLFPLYDGCRKEDVRLIDTRHEQTATFAAEGLAKLTRRPQVAALTAGPGVTNGVSAVATARFSGSPLLVLGGRAPLATWGSGSLQEIDHVAFMAPLTKHALTSTDPGDVAGDVVTALKEAGTPHRGPTFVDIPMDVIFSPADEATVPDWTAPERLPVDTAALDSAAAALGAAQRPLLVAGTDVWLGDAAGALRALTENTRVPVLLNGMGRGLLPGDHDQVISRARSAALKDADLVIVVGTPLDFRLGFGRFGSAGVVHLADSPEGVATHAELLAGVGGDLDLALRGLLAVTGGPTGDLAAARGAWLDRMRDIERSKRAEEIDLLEADTDPIHPARVYGELRRVLDSDAVVIGDGGDFVSFAGRLVDSQSPGCWMDPGPYGCLGTGIGYAAAARLARPEAQVCTLLGDGAAGFSLMDVDTLVRHDLPVVMIVGNNGIWALEKFPMQAVYDGWDAAADLQPGLRYDDVVRALGGAGETVEKSSDLGPALERAFAAGVPYLVNVLTDPSVAYPRRTVLA